MKTYKQSNVELEKVIEFLSTKEIDNNLIYLLKLYSVQNSKNFQYLASEFANILSTGITANSERENDAWLAIEMVIGSLKYHNDERTYFIGTWRSFSILIPNFENFDRHCEAVKSAYFRFENYFASVRYKLHAKDSWYTDITNYDWWLKVDEFYKSRYGI